MYIHWHTQCGSCVSIILYEKSQFNVFDHTGKTSFVHIVCVWDGGLRVRQTGRTAVSLGDDPFTGVAVHAKYCFHWHYGHGRLWSTCHTVPESQHTCCINQTWALGLWIWNKCVSMVGCIFTKITSVILCVTVLRHFIRKWAKRLNQVFNPKTQLWYGNTVVVSHVGIYWQFYLLITGE